MKIQSFQTGSVHLATPKACDWTLAEPDLVEEGSGSRKGPLTPTNTTHNGRQHNRESESLQEGGR